MKFNKQGPNFSFLITSLMYELSVNYETFLEPHLLYDDEQLC